MGTPFPTTGEVPRNGSNTSQGMDPPCKIQDDFLVVTLPVMYSIISIIGFFGNTLALWVFHFGTQKMNSITVYMKNLAISDLLLALCLPFRLAFQNRRAFPVLCKVIGMVFYITMYVSIFLLSLISLDRYLKIIRPLEQFRIHTVSRSTAAARVVWLLCIAVLLSLFLDHSKEGPCSQMCFHFKRKGTMSATLNMIAVGVFFVLLLFFFYSYGKISRKLYAVSIKSTQQQSRKSSGRAVLKTFVVLAVFTLCFMPYHVVRVPYILAQVGLVPDKWIQALHLANELVLCISALNCCLDPVIFFFLSSSFKQALLAATHGKLNGAWKKKPDQVLNPRKSNTDSRTQGI
ncbi:hypothetical protein lerEdw1_014473 [Lerista edwardsae]|nr:hypothetical protein lerEdw1_014473 [Lerista edwardsae]